MKHKYIVIALSLILAFTFAASAFAAEPICIKTGRQYYIAMATHMQLKEDLNRFKRKFNELANNLPKLGVMSEFAPSLASIMQLADTVCSRYADRLPGFNSISDSPILINETYRRMLGREATSAEIAMLSGNEFTGLFERGYAACMKIGISFEYIKNGKSCN